MTERPRRLGLDAATVVLARVDLAAVDAEQLLAVVADVARWTVPGVDAAVVTLTRDGEQHVVAATDDRAVTLAGQQLAAGSGPGVDVAEGEPALIRDTAADDRWPEHARHAAAAGWRCSLTVRLPAGGDAAATMTVYATTPDGLDETAARTAVELARYASVVVANHVRYHDAVAVATHLREAMASRAVIEQAKGMLMILHRCDADEAFGHLVRASQGAGVKLRDVAAGFVTAESAASAESAESAGEAGPTAVPGSAPGDVAAGGRDARSTRRGAARR